MFNTETPLGEGTKRAIITALITGVYMAVITYQGMVQACAALLEGCVAVESDRIRNAVIAGILAALAPFVIQGAQALTDQKRADRGEVIPSDVPIAIAAKNSGVSPKTVARDFAPSKLR